MLIEKVLSVGEEQASCQVTVGDGVLAPFLTPDGDLPAWFGIEMIAQTIGAGPAGMAASATTASRRRACY